jgi:hypothetical protein
LLAAFARGVAQAHQEIVRTDIGGRGAFHDQNAMSAVVGEAEATICIVSIAVKPTTVHRRVEGFMEGRGWMSPEDVSLAWTRVATLRL